MLHLAAYTLLLLANLMDDPLQEINIGWSLIGIIGLIFLVNFGYMVSINCRKTFTDLKFWWMRRKLAKKQAEYEKRQAIELAKA